MPPGREAVFDDLTMGLMKSLFHTLLPSAFGTFGIVWQETDERPKVHRVFLPNERTPVENLVQMTFVDASPLSCPAIAELGGRIQSFLEGEAVDFELDSIALERCSRFQRRRLRFGLLSLGFLYYQAV